MQTVVVGLVVQGRDVSDGSWQDLLTCRNFPVEFSPTGPFRHGLASDSAVAHCVQGHGLGDVVGNVEAIDPLVDFIHHSLVVGVAQRWGEGVGWVPVVLWGIEDGGDSKGAWKLVVIFERVL